MTSEKKRRSLVENGYYKAPPKIDRDGYLGGPLRAANAHKWARRTLFGLFLLGAAYSCHKVIDTISDNPKKAPNQRLPV